ncbi:MAG: dihydroneopterin aldolase, partial [Verrucomicrobiae bacterium]|nr:dihydroneopterin aldolase [Verrucomicrobiae bacterium]
MDTIIIQDLEILCCVGVNDSERARPQKLLVSVEMTTDVSTAAAKDDVRWTIDYQAVCQRIEAISKERSWSLIETLAVDIADTLMREFTPVSTKVEIKKFSLPNTAFV